ncbi:MAG: ATP-dependent phosphofructokinase / diphosphate-dependent phosphofructokinase, partial [Thermodesulfobacteriota bacterium]|nr:ATP-dependent phosphofructokinase / diphosphate-dependent phosphofructokinase [Thermodesulfobacteriota bacterium]
VQAAPLSVRDMDGLLIRGGTILGTANSGKFSSKTGQGETRKIPENLMAQVRQTIEALGLNALVVIGGDGTLTTALQMHESGLPVIGVPKTIDNDLDATQQTFGFDTAVACAVDALDRLHSTAQSHNRVMVLEVMGRYAGWIAAYAGLAGGADVILIPEIKFNMPSIEKKIRAREATGKLFTIVIVAEGAKLDDSMVVSDNDETDREVRLGGIGYAIAEKIQEKTGKESRCVVLGHLQRGGQPTHWDRQLCTRFGVQAVHMAAGRTFGKMVALKPSGMMGSVNLKDAVNRIRSVDPHGELILTARTLGICFGDEI